MQKATSHCTEYVDKSKSRERVKEEESIPDAIASGTPPPKKERTENQRIRDAAQTAVREHFEHKTGLTLPTGNNRKGIASQWWNPIKELLTMTDYDVGRATALVDAALLRLEGLTVSDPHSLLKTARSLIAEKKRKSTIPRDEFGGINLPMSRDT